MDKKKLTKAYLEEILAQHGIHPDSLSKVRAEENTWLYRKGFFYTYGATAQTHADKLAQVPCVKILQHYEVWKPFRGGAPLAQQSHWAVKFTFDQSQEKEN